MSVRLAFLGDTLLGGTGQPVLDAHGHQHPLVQIAPLIADADLVIANHEGPITDLTQSQAKSDTGRKRYWYRAEPAAAHALKAAGIGLVSLANNHVTDYGTDGLADTIRHLEDAGISHCGAGANDVQARGPAILTVGGIRIGFLSAMQRYDMYVRERAYASTTRPGPARLRMSRMAPDLAALGDQTDLVVVLVHWGRNYRDVTPLQEELASELVNAGAHLVVGHHPHIPQRIDRIGQTPVLYSLGNAALGTPGRFHSGRAPHGLIALADISPGRVDQLTVHVIDVDNSKVHYQPRPTSRPASLDLLARLTTPQILALATS